MHELEKIFSKAADTCTRAEMRKERSCLRGREHGQGSGSTEPTERRNESSHVGRCCGGAAAAGQLMSEAHCSSQGCVCRPHRPLCPSLHSELRPLPQFPANGRAWCLSVCILEHWVYSCSCFSICRMFCPHLLREDETYFKDWKMNPKKEVK